MKDWHLEATHLRHLGVDVKRVQITVQSVEESLVWGCLLNSREVRASLWCCWVNLLDGSLVAKSTDASDEKICGDLCNQISALFILDCGLDYNNSCLLLILQVNELILSNESSFCLNWLEHLQAFLSMEQHHGVECWHSWN